MVIPSPNDRSKNGGDYHGIAFRIDACPRQYGAMQVDHAWVLNGIKFTALNYGELDRTSHSCRSSHYTNTSAASRYTGGVENVMAVNSLISVEL